MGGFSRYGRIQPLSVVQGPRVESLGLGFRVRLGMDPGRSHPKNQDGFLSGQCLGCCWVGSLGVTVTVWEIKGFSTKPTKR